MGEDGKKPDVIPPAPPGAVTCPACGWPNPPGSVRCEFCTTSFEPARPKPPPEEILCPHCGASSLVMPGRRRCPDCRRLYSEPPSPLRVLSARFVRLVRGVRISAHAFVFVVIVGMGLTGFFLQNALANRSRSADHVRQVKQMLEIFEIENGGYPGSLEDMGKMMGPLPPHLLVDGWDRPLRYSASDPYPSSDGRMSYSGIPLYRRCDLRSAGPDGDFETDDDLAWIGEPTY